MPINGHKGDRMRLLSGLSLTTVAVLAVGIVATVGCSRMGQLKGMKSFKEANAAYQQQDYKTAADFYEQTVPAAPDDPNSPPRTSTSATATTTSSNRARRARRPTTSS